LRPTPRPPQRLIRLHTFARRSALPAAPPHESPGPPAVEPPADATAQDTREEPRRDAPPADTLGKQRGAADKLDELREKALAASYDEYKELTGAWRNLDAKAQGNITVAGIFIAGAFAYLTKFTQPGIAEAGIFFLTVLFLMVCVVLSVLVLRVSEVPPHYLGGFMRYMVRALEGKTNEEFQVHLPLYHNEHAAHWNESSEKLIVANESKGKLLWAAQVFLIAAILSVALLVVFKLLTSG
jgi:hypothetical protein